MNTQHIVLATSICIGGLVLSFSAFSQESGRVFSICSGLTDEACTENLAELAKKPVADIQADFLVPDSPAFDVLGVKPENVVNPASARSFGLSLLNGADPQGNIQTGFALDTAPYQFTGVTLGEYRKNYFQRLLSRTQLSIGTTKGGSDDDKSVRASVGLRFTLFDLGDPRLDEGLDKTFNQITDSIFDNLRAKKFEIGDKKADLVERRKQAESANNAALVEELDQQIKMADDELTALAKKQEEAGSKAWESALDEHNKGVWNASSAAIGVAPVFFSETGSYSDLDSEGYAVYGTFAYGFDGFRARPPETGASRGWWARNAQVLVHARYTENQQEALNDGSGFRKQNTTVYGGQFRVQGPRIWSDEGGDLVFSLEASVVDKDFAEGGSESVTRYAGAVEVKPIKNSGFTLKGVIGGQSGGSDNDDSFVAATLNWAL